MKKTILYVVSIIILTILLVFGFRAPKTSNNNTSPGAEDKNNNLNIDADSKGVVENLIGDGNSEKNVESGKKSATEQTNDTSSPPAQKVSPQELKRVLAGFPVPEKTELSFDAYRAFRRNNLVDLSEWDESQIASAPALQVIGNGARAYFKVDLKDAGEVLNFLANPNINTNGWRYEIGFKDDVIEHRPEFKDGALYAGKEKMERGKQIAYALSRDKYFGTWTVFQPRFDDGFLVVYVDIIKE